MLNKKLFITGGTGYIGSRTIPELIKAGFEIKALARKESEKRLPQGCIPVTGNALDRKSYEGAVSGCDTFIHLIGVHHPGPGKKNLFKEIDLVSIEQAVPAAVSAGVKHFIYLSVAHPAPVMKEFVEVRMKGEELIHKSGLIASFIRPWYVLGPGHYWPYLILPLYKLFEIIPSAKETAQRLGLVTINQVVRCLGHAAGNPPHSTKIYNVPDIKKF